MQFKLLETQWLHGLCASHLTLRMAQASQALTLDLRFLLVEGTALGFTCLLVTTPGFETDDPDVFDDAENKLGTEESRPELEGGSGL